MPPKPPKPPHSQPPPPPPPPKPSNKTSQQQQHLTTLTKTAVCSALASMGEQATANGITPTAMEYIVERVAYDASFKAASMSAQGGLDELKAKGIVREAVRNVVVALVWIRDVTAARGGGGGGQNGKGQNGGQDGGGKGGQVGGEAVEGFAELVEAVTEGAVAGWDLGEEK